MLILSPDYQTRHPAASTARLETAATAATTRKRMASNRNSSLQRDDGRTIVSLDRGRVQAASKAIRVAVRDGRRGLTAGSTALGIYATFLLLLAVTATVLLINRGGAADLDWALLGLGLAAVAAERMPVRLGPRLEMSAALIPCLIAAVVFGPLPALIVYAASMVGDLKGPAVRWAIYAGGRACVGAAAGLAAHAFNVDLADPRVTDVALSACAAALAAQGAELLWVTATAALRGASVAEILSAGWQVLLVEPPFHTTVVTMVVIGFQYLSFWAIVLVVPPVLLVQRLYVLYRDQRRLAARLLSANEALERANLSFSSSLIAALDARDRYTAGHSAAVAIYSRDIAKALRLPEEEQFTAHLAGLLHDVGKVGLPPGILEKAGPLTPQERLSMQEHSVIGERILRKVEAYASIATIIRHHHEQFDGCGYPDGLVGEEIPLISRIVAVSDAYNAMTSGRPYRAALDREVAIQRLLAGSGTQFDPKIVAVFIGVLETASDLYSVGARADFAIEAQAEHQLGAELRPAA